MKITKMSGPSFRFPKLAENDTRKKLSQILKEEAKKTEKGGALTIAQELKNQNKLSKPIVTMLYGKDGALSNNDDGNDLGSM